MMGVSGLAGDPASPPRNRRCRRCRSAAPARMLGAAMNKLGWHWWPSDTAVATVDYEGRARCINLGHCTPGCAQGAKASTDITYWPPPSAPASSCARTAACGRSPPTSTAWRAGVVYYDADGVEQFQPAHVVVLACNGVGTPRLLLNSASGRFPDGLANSSGLVGKNLMFHPYAQVYGYVDEPTDGNRAPPTCLWSKEFYETDPSRGFVRGYTFQFGRGAGPVVEAVGERGEGHAALGCRPPRRVPPAELATGSGLSAICEDLPEEHNRVTLDPVLKDSHGIPAPRIDYTISENTARMMEHGIARATEMLRAAGASDICVNSPILLRRLAPAGHRPHGPDPQRSVVNAWGRSHDVKNLFIIDGSVFVTSGGVNPTSTLQALALYIADQMKQRLANLFD